MVWITSIPKWDSPLTVEPVARDDCGRVPARPQTMLIVEDDPTMRLALACMIADSGCQVILASSAEDALERLPLIDPDIILCDFILEGMTGREFCERLKGSERWRYVPVIVVTRMDAPSVVGDLLRSGADDVMIKPVRGEELRARVHAGLRRRANYRQLGGDAPAELRRTVTPFPIRRLNVCA